MRREAIRSQEVAKTEARGIPYRYVRVESEVMGIRGSSTPPGKPTGVDAGIQSVGQVMQEPANQGAPPLLRERRRQAEGCGATPIRIAYSPGAKEDAGTWRERLRIIAGMSQRLPSSLDSVLRLSKQLADNADKHLSPRQVDCAQTIYSSATELLSVIDQILVQAMPDGKPRSDVEQAAPRQRFRAAAARGEAVPSQGPATRPAIDHRIDHWLPGQEVVAIVEGDAALAEQLSDMVRKSGYQGIIASDFSSLRQLIAQSPPDAIILGMTLRDGDGWSALEALKCDPDTRHVPLCMISINGSAHRSLQIEDAPVARVINGAAQPAFAEHSESRRWRHGEVWRVSGDRDGGDVDRGIPIGTSPIGQLQQIMLGAKPDRGGPGDSIVLSSGERSDCVLIEYDDGSTELAVLRPPGGRHQIFEDLSSFLQRACRSAYRERSVASFPAGDVLLGKTVMVVGDDVRALYLMAAAFEQQGMRVVHAADGEEAIAMLRHETAIDAMLLDVEMADVDAEDVIRKIRGVEVAGTLPIIVVTMALDGISRGRWLKAGACDDIAKPVNVEQLLAVLRVRLMKVPLS